MPLNFIPFFYKFIYLIVLHSVGTKWIRYISFSILAIFKVVDRAANWQGKSTSKYMTIFMHACYILGNFKRELQTFKYPLVCSSIFCISSINWTDLSYR